MSWNHKQFGLFERILHGLSWRLPGWFFRYDHSVLVQGQELKLLVRDYSGYVVRPATHDDAEAMRIAGFRKSLFVERIARGDYCILVVKDGKVVVTWSWSATGAVFVKAAGTTVDTGENGIYLYDVYTIPEERHRGLFMSCFKRQLEHYHSNHRDRFVAAISVFNTGSLNAHLRMGFQVCGETSCVTLLGLSVTFYKSWPSPTKRWRVFVKGPAGDWKWV